MQSTMKSRKTGNPIGSAMQKGSSAIQGIGAGLRSRVKSASSTERAMLNKAGGVKGLLKQRSSSKLFT